MKPIKNTPRIFKVIHDDGAAPMDQGAKIQVIKEEEGRVYYHYLEGPYAEDTVYNKERGFFYRFTKEVS